MAIRYSVEQMKVGFKNDKKEAYVGRIQLGDNISTEKLEEQVALRTMLPQTVVHTVFANLVDSVIHFIEEGQGVRMGELGILKPAINTQSAETDEQVKVTRLHLRYIQSKKMRQAIKNLSVRKLSDLSDDEEGAVDEEDADTTTGDAGTGTDTGGDSNPL